MQPATLIAVSQRNKVRVFTKADVLMVIDDSYSMSGKQQRLAAALQDFTEQLDALVPPVDYQVGVTTTSVSERLGACGPAGDASAAAQCDSDWQAQGFSCDSGLACFRPVPPGGQLKAVLERSAYGNAADFAAALAQAVQVGTAGSRQPQGMEAMKIALQQPGFLRDQAKVVAAFFTDAEDCSDPEHRLAMLVMDPKTGNVVDQCALETAPGYDGPISLEPVANYANFLRSLKNSDGSSKEVEIGAVVSLADGTPDPGLCTNPVCDTDCDTPAAQGACQSRCNGSPTFSICMSDCNAECHQFCGGQVPGRRYLELADAFNGVASNVCSDDASPGLARLSAVIGIPKQIVLRALPTSDQYLVVRVERGGASIECVEGVGFTLVSTEDGPAVQFAGDCVLQPDDTWDIRYLATR
ncbi:MAG TPA: hypothetical protein VLW85_25895 [Myxococcales bacterium]|nr:hypothetical protein [Myxococcales bacterium]